MNDTITKEEIIDWINKLPNIVEIVKKVSDKDFNYPGWYCDDVFLAPEYFAVNMVRRDHKGKIKDSHTETITIERILELVEGKT